MNNRPGPSHETLGIHMPAVHDSAAVERLLDKAATTGLAAESDEFIEAMEAALANIGEQTIPEVREEAPNPQLRGWDHVDANLTTSGLTPGTPID